MNEVPANGDYIIQYVNKTIEGQNKIKLINHLKYCPQCREELALLKLAEIVSWNERCPQEF